MQKIIQRRRSEEAWREIVSRQERSGLSVQAYCQREGISAASLYGWRCRLGATRETQIAESRSVESAPTAEFIDLGGLRSGQSRCEIRLDLGGGVVLHLVRS
jgi:transposase-like protein